MRLRPRHLAVISSVLSSLASIALQGASDEEVVRGQLVSVMPASYRPVVWVRIGPTFCTGTLVTPEWVLTAAHCLNELVPGEPFRVVVDTLSIREPDAVERQVVESAIHPGFNPKAARAGFDAALLRLESPALGIAPVWVGATQLSVGQSATVAGFGIYSISPQLYGDLNEGELTIRVLTGRAILTAPGPAMGCLGDSGAPLFVTDPQAGLTQIGIASFGDPNCSAYGVFTPVSSVREWMTDVITGSW